MHSALIGQGRAAELQALFHNSALAGNGSPVNGRNL
jgi:hypothetical protein